MCSCLLFSALERQGIVDCRYGIDGVWAITALEVLLCFILLSGGIGTYHERQLRPSLKYSLTTKTKEPTSPTQRYTSWPLNNERDKHESVRTNSSREMHSVPNTLKKVSERNVLTAPFSRATSDKRRRRRRGGKNKRNPYQTNASMTENKIQGNETYTASQTNHISPAVQLQSLKSKKPLWPDCVSDQMGEHQMLILPVYLSILPYSSFETLFSILQCFFPSRHL